MSIFLASGEVSAAITGSVTATITEHHANNLFAAAVTSGTATIGTVPANKKWTILAYSACTTTQTAGVGESYLEANGVKFAAMKPGTASGVAMASSVNASLGYSDGFQITAGETLTYTCAANCGLAYSIIVFEEAV